MIIITSKTNCAKLFTLFVAHKDLSEATIFLLPHSSSFLSLDIYFPSLTLFIHLFLTPAPPNLFSHLHQVKRSQWGFSWHIFDGRYSGKVPHTLNIDDRLGYRHATLPPRCSPLGSQRQRLGLFKCQFIFYAHYRECASSSVSREKSLVRSQCNLG